jgi:hypothetical protein
MTTAIENPDECRDFGNSPTLRISAFDADDLFKLGRMSCYLEELNADHVIGTSADGMGKYLRIPLACKLP